jgi:predicted TPR repeat methyltransferase
LTRIIPLYHLNPRGRYKQNRAYVESVLGLAGFERIESEPVHLRNEGGVPVQGWLMTAHRPGSQGAGGLASTLRE